MSRRGDGGALGEAARRILEGLEQSLGVTRVLWELLAPGAAGRDPAEHAGALETAFTRLQEQAREVWSGAWAGSGLGGAGFSGAGPGGAGLGGAGLGGAGPGGPAAEAPDTGAGGFEAAWLRAATQFDWPALGLTRERQEAAQRLARAARDFSQAQLRLALLWGQIVREALQALTEKVAAELAQGRAIAGPRELYDLWIDCGEAAFARHAHGGEFARAQGALTDAASTLRIEQRQAIESWARELDLPTRAELDSVHLRLKALRTEVRTLQRELAESRATRTARAPARRARPTAAKPAKRSERAKRAKPNRRRS